MRVTDLMVGDWVSYCGFYNKVIYIGQKVSMYDGKGTEFTTDPEHIRPIPLTEEILVKNSNMVECFTGRLYWLDDEEHCAVKPYKSKYLFMYKHGVVDASIPIEFVHQLQHCMRLFGVEPLLGTNEIKL